MRRREGGVKDRPCAVLLTVKSGPATHRNHAADHPHAPPNPGLTVEIPHATKKRFGLDDARSWVIPSEANRFIWSGPNLRPLPGDPASIAYGCSRRHSSTRSAINGWPPMIGPRLAACPKDLIAIRFLSTDQTMNTASPFFARSNRRLAKSSGTPMQPWVARPSRMLLAWIAMPSPVSRSV